MKKLYILVIALFILNNVRAQTYVTIPDTNFVAWLQMNVGAAMNGNQMDITHHSVTSLMLMQIQGRSIADISGIQYFTSLMDFNCSNNSITSISALPNSIRNLFCQNNQITSLPSLPSLLSYLDCSNNQLTSLPALPGSLGFFDCHNNHISSFPNLPVILQKLICYNNELTNLPTLPMELQQLTCSYNQLTSIPALPNSLTYLLCSHNCLTNLPVLPSSIFYLICDSNQLTSIPSLPDSLRDIDCSHNQLISIPALPNKIQYLICGYNHLTNLPSLPNSLISLNCENNQLTSLPNLPAELAVLHCNDNQLTSLPNLPNWLSYLNCSNNSITCLPSIPEFYWQELNLSGNPFTCLPNYVSYMDANLLNYPLCQTGDAINNPYNCSSFNGIAGNIYKDNNANCLKESGELNIKNVHISLYDSVTNLIDQTYSLTNGAFLFSVLPGTYSVRIDTAGMPYYLQCSNPGVDTTIILTTANATVYDLNYALGCKPEFDIGVQSVVSDGLVFPGQTHELLISAGDLSHWNQLDCANGVSGQVQITVTGPVIYQGVVAGSLTPSIAGNVYTYSIPDFGYVNNATSFRLIFLTDTTALSDSLICVHVAVTPLSGDNNKFNNSYDYCYNVSNSMDPNFKEVYPVKLMPGYNDYLKYMIHFQNTGTANAINIRILDTLDSKLDMSSFKVINYSHENNVTINDNILTVRFHDIQLPDSTTNPEGSKGFFQYCIKPKTNLSVGTKIINTAWIYFDYNAPIATNTTTNVFDVTGINESYNSNQSFFIYPNPAKNTITLLCPAAAIHNRQLSLTNIQGQLLIQQIIREEKSEIDITRLARGIYILKLEDDDKTEVGKIVKE